MKIDNLYDPPFIQRGPHGPEDLFTASDIDAIEAVLKAVQRTAHPRHIPAAE